VAVLSTYTNRVIRRRYRLELKLDLQDEGAFAISPPSLVTDYHPPIFPAFIHVSHLPYDP
jgi:hypothetical protein